MAGRTIYVKPEKEYLYDKAVKYSGQKSLSSLIEKTIDNLIQENERNFRNALMIMAADRSGVTSSIGLLIELAKKSISKELLDRAEHVLDVFEDKGLFNGIWKGPKSRGGDDDWFWYVTMVEDDDSNLEEMYNMAISQEFNEMEKDYKKREELISELLKKMDKFKKAQNIDKEKILKEISDLGEGEIIEYLANLVTNLNPNKLKDKEDKKWKIE